ncbi:hypothetical protein H0H92_007672 [Tricholoma furcatifolium]|nr:hypothetical protein H0H92_007672 [Tricholoma furcatifolium]
MHLVLQRKPSPPLPREVLLSIFKLAFWDHRIEPAFLANRFARELKGDTREACIDETDWRNYDDLKHITSSCVFPTAPASVSKTWREAMSMLAPAWSRVVIFIDLPDCLSFARSQVQWSQWTTFPIDLVISNQGSGKFPGSSEDEWKMLRSIINIVRPLFPRCRTILFNVTYTSSLPRLVTDFPDIAPVLKSLRLRAEVPNNGMQGFMDGSLPPGFQFPILEKLEIDGWNFIELSLDGGRWLECLCKNEGKYQRLTVAHYKPTIVQGKTVQLFMNDVLPSLAGMQSISLKEVDFACDFDIESTATCHSDLKLSGLDARLTAFMLLNRTVESMTLRRCSLSQIDFDLSVDFLSLCDIDYPESGSDLRDLLRHWDGRLLRVTNCPRFDDSVINVFSEPIPAGTEGEHTLRGAFLSSIFIKECHGFSIAALREMTDVRHAHSATQPEADQEWGFYPRLEVQVCDVPDLDVEDRIWFKRLFGEHNLGLHDHNIYERTGVWPVDIDLPLAGSNP